MAADLYSYEFDEVEASEAYDLDVRLLSQYDLDVLLEAASTSLPSVIGSRIVGSPIVRSAA